MTGVSGYSVQNRSTLVVTLRAAGSIEKFIQTIKDY